MNKSDSVKELAGALAKAQSVMEGAKKDRQNPHLKNKYADLSSVWEVCRKPLTDNGLSISQLVGSDDGKQVTVTTMILHESGEWMSMDFTMPALENKGINIAQAMGSAISYIRRYQLAGIAGVSQEDDDAQSAPDKAPSVPAYITSTELVEKLKESKVLKHLGNVWDKYAPDMAKMTEGEQALCAKTKNEMKVQFNEARDEAVAEIQTDLDGIGDEPPPEDPA